MCTEKCSDKKLVFNFWKHLSLNVDVLLIELRTCPLVQNDRRSELPKIIIKKHYT